MWIDEDHSDLARVDVGTSDALRPLHVTQEDGGEDEGRFHVHAWSRNQPREEQMGVQSSRGTRWTSWWHATRHTVEDVLRTTSWNGRVGLPRMVQTAA